jgi:hypothetical protein
MTCKITEISNDELLELLTLTVTKSDDATVYTNASGQCHRIHGPAVIYADGTQMWYRHGNLHRDNGPAVLWNKGSGQFWKNGVLTGLTD